MAVTDTLLSDLERLIGTRNVLPGTTARYLTDGTETRGLRGRADAVCIPADTQDVAKVVAWCYNHDTPIVPRGGGTGYAGGAVPIDGGVVLSLERLNRIRSIDPGLWRMKVDAGVTTAVTKRIARESGLFFPPDPGAAESSQIGGNIATNAGGPHAFKYGVTGNWVTGVEVVVADGETISLGGAIRKDVAGYDLKSLLIGSEGTLGIITSAWLALTPAPEAVLPAVAFYDTVESGCEAVESVLGNGLTVAALEYLDGITLEIAKASYPKTIPAGSRFMVIAEADGSTAEAHRIREELVEVLCERALGVTAPTEDEEITALWRWRDGLSLTIAARRGYKISEDIVVPIDRLGEAINAVIQIGESHDLEACSWGHAGDGNLHATFLLTPGDTGALSRANDACSELFALAGRLEGSVSGEHGIGWVKRGELARQWNPAALALHTRVKQAFDPKGLLNPGKKA
jgi:glycolate oxidase subunit GlcD